MARYVNGEDLDDDLRQIAQILTRRNEPLVLSSMTSDHATELKVWLAQHKAKVLQEISAGAGSVLPQHDELDFPETANLFDLDVALRSYHERGHIPKAKVAVGVYRIATDEELQSQWKALGYNSSSRYCDDRLGIGTDYHWLLKIGAAIVTHRDRLTALGFTITNQLYKLAYLEKALERAESEEQEELVFCSLTYESFMSFKRLATGDGPISETTTRFRKAVVERASKLMKKLKNIEGRGEFPVILEITTAAEKAAVLGYDAANRPEKAELSTESDAA